MNYNHGGPEIETAKKNKEKMSITVNKYQGDMASTVNILIWEINHEETKRKDTTFKENNRKSCSMILHHCTPKI